MIELYTVLTEASLELYGAMGFDACGESEFLLNIDGKMRRCIKAYFNPGDAPGAGKSGRVAVAFEADESKCRVAEGAYRTGDILAPDVLEAEYEAGMVKMPEYRIGMYIKPECIITKDDIGQPPLRRLDGTESNGWAVYDLAEVMYNEQRLTELVEDSQDFVNDALYGYYEKQVRIGRAKKLEHEGWDYVLFTMNGSGRKVLLRKGNI